LRLLKSIKLGSLSGAKQVTGAHGGRPGGGTAELITDRFSLHGMVVAPNPSQRFIYPRTRDSCNNSESIHFRDRILQPLQFISSNPICIHRFILKNCDSLGALLRSKKIAGLGLAMRFTGASLTYTPDVRFLLLALLKHTYLLSEPYRKKTKIVALADCLVSNYV
jgi:hypothetical protein